MGSGLSGRKVPSVLDAQFYYLVGVGKRGVLGEYRAETRIRFWVSEDVESSGSHRVGDTGDREGWVRLE